MLTICPPVVASTSALCCKLCMLDRSGVCIGVSGINFNEKNVLRIKNSMKFSIIFSKFNKIKISIISLQIIGVCFFIIIDRFQEKENICI